MTSSADTAATVSDNQENLGKFGRAMRKAGTMFGIDLAGLFEDDGEMAEGFEGFAPTFKMTSNLKGRSPSTSTYKAPKTPSRTSEFTLGPKPEGAGGSGSLTIQMPSAPQAAPQAEAPVVEQAPKYNWTSNLKGGGFGTADYQEARAKGFSDEAIREYITANPGQFGGSGLNIGEDVRQQLGLGDMYQSDLAKIATGKADQVKATGYNWRELTKARGGIGAEAVQQALSAGYAPSDIETYAKAYGLTVGEKAAGMLPGLAQQRQAQTSKAPANYQGSIEQIGKVGAQAQYSKPTGSIGLEGIKRAAAAQGISPQEAARRAVAQGTSLGALAQGLLG